MKQDRKKSVPREDQERVKSRSLRLVITYFVFTLMIVSQLLTALILILIFVMFGSPGLLSNQPLFMLLLNMIPSVLIGSAISALFSNRVLKPLRETIRAAKKIGEGDFSVRLETRPGIYEVAELQENFNHMAEDLGRLEIFRNDFINNFSHEFKTPIVSIRGFAHQLRYEDLPADKREEYLEIICRESDRLTKLSTSVLLLSRYENQSIVTDKVRYDLDEQIRNCIVLLEKQWSEKELELDLELDRVQCYANEEMLGQLFVNLIGNAVKFNPRGGTLGVRLTQEGKWATVEIRDTGAGIPEDVMPHIFEKFYQGDSSHRSEGNGIGLTLVKRIVELCEGEIIPESRENEGTVFTLRLPIAELPAEVSSLTK